jgi:hypothetical protein
MPITFDKETECRLRNLVEKYAVLKRLTLHFEETYGKSFPPAVLGTRDALDHLMRSFSRTINPKGPTEDECGIMVTDEEYINRNIRSAESHIYRAMFELLDISAAKCRGDIIDIVKQYSNETISVCAPDYFKIREFLVEMEGKVETYRGKKDAHSIDMDDVDRYLKDVQVLEAHNSYIQKCTPQMEQYEKESRIRIKDSIDKVNAELKESRKLNKVFGVVTIASCVFGAAGVLLYFLC